MRQPRTTRARKVLQKPEILGWDTSDEQEIEVRRWRGRTEIEAIEALEPDIRTLRNVPCALRPRAAPTTWKSAISAAVINSCGCIDHRVNGLGTCKHIEGVLAALRRRGARAFKAAAKARLPRVEIFLAPRRRSPPGHALARDAADQRAGARVG